jgi:2-iminobutanoate/2-iminopropanoate deaminase
MSGMRLVDPDTMRAPAGHYSHGVCANGFVFVSGQLPVKPDGTKLADQPFDVQARQVLANVRSVLEACGSSVGRLVQVRVYVTDIDRWALFNQVYEQWIGAHRPARAVVPVPVLHYGLAIEVEAVALA